MLRFDAMGRRIAKHVYDDSWTLEKSTYYALDAQGNAMSVYEYAVDNVNSTVTYTQEEKYIYGSSRLGVLNESVYLFGSVHLDEDMSEQTHTTGQRNYELTNHLGNVLSVISDKIKPHDDDSDGTIDWYVADIRQSTDYSPFGAILHGRNMKLEDPVTGNPVDKMRFGFQNQEMDDEIKGEGNSVNYTFRMHDPRLGRFFSIDPLTKKYPYWSTYQFSGNRVIDAVELEGLELKTVRLTLATHPNGDIYIKNCTVMKIIEDYNVTVKVKGKDMPGSETQVIYNYDGETTQHMLSIYEPKDFGTSDPRFKGLYSSAKYDYTSSESMKQKMADDAKWIASFGADPVQAMMIIQVRDQKAPDAIYSNQGINDLLEAMPALAGTQFLWIGKFKLRRDEFHKAMKPTILKAADKAKYEKVVGKNPDIGISKGGTIELKGTGKFKGKSYNTGLDPTKYLKE